jgi:predicted Rossmann-fold nucleotide-binding protein
LTLIQTGMGRQIPIILVGSAFWGGLLQWMRERLVADGMIAAKDMDLMQIVDDANVVTDRIFDFYERRGFAQSGDEREQLLYL